MHNTYAHICSMYLYCDEFPEKIGRETLDCDPIKSLTMKILHDSILILSASRNYVRAYAA